MSVVSVSPSVVAALSSSPDRSPDWPNTCHSVEKRAPKAREISKRLLPILRTASQLLGQNFPRANDPAGDASYLEPFGSHFELELKFQWEISTTQNLKFVFV